MAKIGVTLNKYAPQTLFKSHFHSSSRNFATKTAEAELPEYIYAGKNIKPHMRVYVMGVTTHGALGIKNFLKPVKTKQIYRYMHRPHRLEFADKYKVEDISCGNGFSILAMKNKDYLPIFFGMGLNSNGQIGVVSLRNKKSLHTVIEPSPIKHPPFKDAKVKKVSCGRAHSLLYTDSNGLWTVGNNSLGQCGRPLKDDEDYSETSHFHFIKKCTGNLQQIACGQDSSFVLQDGNVYSCGWSADGQTGLNTFDSVYDFNRVEGELKDEKIIKISTSGDFVLALNDKGDVFGWGNGEYRQLESVTSEQQLNIPLKLNLNIPDKIVDVAASGTACFVVTDAGEVWSWGYGIIGQGPNEIASTEPQPIANTLLGRNILNPDSKVTKIFAGLTMAGAVTNNGSLYTWGRNIGGCLGLGHTEFQHFPMRVCVSSAVEKVSCGADHMIVMGKSLM